jgi:hypothetical protein
MPSFLCFRTQCIIGDWGRCQRSHVAFCGLSLGMSRQSPSASAPSRADVMQPEERVTLAALRRPGKSLRAFGQVLRRSAGSLSGELARNAIADGMYCSRGAQRRMRRATHVFGRRPARCGWPAVAAGDAHTGLAVIAAAARADTSAACGANPDLHVSQETMFTTRSTPTPRASCERS